jgi:hypothetical protein
LVLFASFRLVRHRTPPRVFAVVLAVIGKPESGL